MHHSPPPPSLTILILLTAVSVLATSLFLPSLSMMAEDFSVDYAMISSSVSAYLLVTAILQLILGPLSDRFGRRPILLWSLGGFSVASIGCALAPEFWLFIWFRMLQGVVIAASAVSRAIVRDRVEPQQATSMLGYMGMAMAVAPMMGPMLGGAVAEWFGWRANFWLFAILGVGLFLLCWYRLGETNLQQSNTILQQFQTYPELFGSRRFWGYSLCIAFSVGAFYSFLAGAPLVVPALFGLSMSELGFILGSITGGFFAGSFFSGRYSHRFEIVSLVLWGRVIGCSGLVLALLLQWLGEVHLWTLMLAILPVGFGNGLSVPGSTAGVLSVRPQLAGSAAGLSGALGVAGGAFITFITGALVNEQTGYASLLSIMLLSTLAGLLCALYVLSVERASKLSGV